MHSAVNSAGRGKLWALLINDFKREWHCMPTRTGLVVRQVIAFLPEQLKRWRRYAYNLPMLKRLLIVWHVIIKVLKALRKPSTRFSLLPLLMEPKTRFKC